MLGLMRRTLVGRSTRSRSLHITSEAVDPCYLARVREPAELPQPEDLIEIVENSMSSETYDLLKRPDELFVVNKAHQNPRFVEDVVREILAGALNMFPDFGDDTFVSASQVNYESIHKHDAFAEAFGQFGKLRGTNFGRSLRLKDRPIIVVKRKCKVSQCIGCDLRP